MLTVSGEQSVYWHLSKKITFIAVKLFHISNIIVILALCEHFFISSALKRVTSAFSAWRGACWRVYSYTMPTYAFADLNDLSEDYRITKGTAIA